MTSSGGVVPTGFQLVFSYDPRYLAGWPAEIYQKTLAEASLDARKQEWMSFATGVQGVLGSA